MTTGHNLDITDIQQILIACTLGGFDFSTTKLSFLSSMNLGAFNSKPERLIS